jgi:hypothetical protein
MAKKKKKEKAVAVLCEACGKKIPQGRLKVMPDTKHCVNCVDEHGEQVAVVPIITKDNLDVAIIRDADPTIINQLEQFDKYETRI